MKLSRQVLCWFGTALGRSIPLSATSPPWRSMSSRMTLWLLRVGSLFSQKGLFGYNRFVFLFNILECENIISCWKYHMFMEGDCCFELFSEPDGYGEKRNQWVVLVLLFISRTKLPLKFTITTPCYCDNCDIITGDSIHLRYPGDHRLTLEDVDSVFKVSIKSPKPPTRTFDQSNPSNQGLVHLKNLKLKLKT